MKLKCIASAMVKGEVVKKGTVANYDESLAKQLLASGRFEPVIDEDKKPAKAAKAE
jgi:hypothetical protein